MWRKTRYQFHSRRGGQRADFSSDGTPALVSISQKGVTVWGSFTSAPFVGNFNEGSLIGKRIFSWLKVISSPRISASLFSLFDQSWRKMLHERKSFIDLGRPSSIHTTLSRPFCTRHYEARQLSAFCDATRHRKRRKSQPTLSAPLSILSQDEKCLEHNEECQVN